MIRKQVLLFVAPALDFVAPYLDFVAADLVFAVLNLEIVARRPVHGFFGRSG
jgi:hypothetical protein